MPGEQARRAAVGLAPGDAGRTAWLEGRAENDRLNGLIVYARLSWRQVDLLRAYQVYYIQVNPFASRRFITETMLTYPECARILFEFFEARFSPGATAEQREERMLQARCRPTAP